ncbi:hypothetical protein HZA75_06260 [Candidatus Roizmanbacteria bacterium]|nr:hypothetical protein [Candidatus Roizmanbacteria bacterium]
MKKIIISLLLILLIFLAVFPRSVELFNKNYIFLFDQGRDLLDVKNIVVNHKFTLIGAEIGSGSAGFSYIFQGPGYYYLLAIPFLLFRGDPYGTIVLMWFLSIVVIIIGFFLGKKIFSNSLFGIIAALLIAASPPLIAQARFAWAPYPTTIFIMLSFLFTFLAQKRPLFLFLAAFFAGITYNFEFAVAVPLSLSLLIFTILVLRACLKSEPQFARVR